MTRDKFTIPAWTTLAVGVAIHTAIAVSYIHATFETAAHARDNLILARDVVLKLEAETVQRLQRMEDKLDRLIERRP